MTRFATIAFVICGALVSNIARASSTTYDFTQTGFSDSNGDPGTLSGSFVATPEANGTIQTGDVLSFTATFKETATGGAGAGKVDSFLFNVLNDLSYDPANPGTLEFSSGSLTSGIILCSGRGDVNGVCVTSSSPLHAALDATGFFEDLPDFGVSLTQNAATITAVPSAQAPEPSTLAVFSTGLLLLLSGCVRRRALERRLADSARAASV